MTDKRLIEVAFPLKQASIDSVHEKNVRHGHISTLHIWPARRPLAACRAALIATLLPDPGTPEKRKELCEKIGGKVVRVVKRKKLPTGKVEDKVAEETVGGILHWGRESENKADVDWFREEIRKAYGGRAPKVLDPFAGGGAIPLEAMRLGCEVTAIDINPVAWFILKCTLKYPQKLAGQKRRLPDFALRDVEFMEDFFKANGFKKAQIRTFLSDLGLTQTDFSPPLPGMIGQNVDATFLEADLAWHVRAWGRWVLVEARKELARFYPTYADYQPLPPTRGKSGIRLEEWVGPRQPTRLVPIDENGVASVDAWNQEVFDNAFKKDKRYFGREEGLAEYRASRHRIYMDDHHNPRWLLKPTVAYLWARTVRCKNCRAIIPLLKTRWLAKKDNKRVLLTMEPNADRTGAIFGVESKAPAVGGNNAQKREHDRRLGAGTMSRAGAWCPCCGKQGTVAMEMEDIRQEGVNGRLGAIMTAVVVDGPEGKEYRPPAQCEVLAVETIESLLDHDGVASILRGAKTEFRPESTRSISAQLYGVRHFEDLFNRRQLLSLAQVGATVRRVREQTEAYKYDADWQRTIVSYLCLAFDRLLSFCCVNVRWKVDAEAVVDAFSRFSISLLWDFAEGCPVGHAAGCWALCFERIATALDTYGRSPLVSSDCDVQQQSADRLEGSNNFDLILTDPPYYQAISYADLSDFFYVWLRAVFPFAPAEFDTELTNKNDEIVQHIREDKNREVERNKYENKMAASFKSVYQLLADNGRFVIVFAHKDPDAWETLVSAMIQAGFTVVASWPIETEMQSRQRAAATASLASSVWLVCQHRPSNARPGWDNIVIAEMRKRIYQQLRTFWDANIRGPDFVWAATGPALEAFSKHPFVKMADSPGETMKVSEFLRTVRRIVVEFVVGRVLTEASGMETDIETAASLDDVTTYYLLHRHDFGMDDAPAGACILYAVSCNLSESDLADKYDLLVRSGGVDKDDDGEADAGDADAEGEAEEGTGSTFKLKAWKQRKRPGMGVDPLADSARSRRRREEAMEPRLIPDTESVESAAASLKTMPLIDQIHRLMHLWKAGDQIKVDAYLEDRGLRRSELFKQLLQAMIELSPEASEERSVLESISNHLRIRGMKARETAPLPFVEIVEAEQE